MLIKAGLHATFVFFTVTICFNFDFLDLLYPNYRLSTEEKHFLNYTMDDCVIEFLSEDMGGGPIDPRLLEPAVPREGITYHLKVSIQPRCLTRWTRLDTDLSRKRTSALCYYIHQ